MDHLALKDIFARMWKHKQDGARADGASKDATVLIVDDSRTVVHALKVLLERAGYQTIAAFDGEQALQVARAQKLDLILMDIVMPRMNGFEATRALAGNPATAAIPVIIVSGTDQPSDKVWGFKVGAKGFLAKPFRKEELLSTVGTVLMHAWRAQAKKSAHLSLVAPNPAEQEVL